MKNSSDGSGAKAAQFVPAEGDELAAAVGVAVAIGLGAGFGVAHEATSRATTTVSAVQQLPPRTPDPLVGDIS